MKLRLYEKILLTYLLMLRKKNKNDIIDGWEGIY